MFSMPILAVFWLIPFMIKLAIAVAVSTGVSMLLAKKPQGAKPAGQEDFDLPTAEEGRPLPALFGCRRIRSPNAVSPLIDFYAKSKKKQSGTSKVTVAHYYYIGLHLGVCQANIDGIRQIWVAETCVWPVLDDPDSQAADGQTLATIEAGECFGGYKREGGVLGPVHIQYGGAGQTLDSYLSAKLGADQPAYRGFTGVVLAFVYIGTVPQIKPWSFLGKRVDKLTDGSAMWYLSKAPVGSAGDLNAIHILYELLTSTVIGLGKDASLIGTSFIAAADICYTEGYGLSAVWDSASDDVEGLVQQIEAIIDGKVYVDPETGKFEIGLVRADYDPEELEAFDESDFWVEQMPASSPGKVPSKTVVYWHDRQTLESRPAYDDDIALLARQGGRPVIAELDYSAFVCSGDLAGKIAAREQQQVSAMPKSLTLRALRTMAHLHETDVIKISYPALNIASMIVRVVTIDRGSLGDGGCVLDVIEDVFGQSYTAYGTPPAAGAGTAGESMEDRFLDDDGSSQIVFTTSSTETGPY
ncbi:MAG: hypothetical protein ABFE13_01490 [Phycisphaerales bacterium]